jgi:hypothetical protein
MPTWSSQATLPPSITLAASMLHVDADSKAANGFELVIATLNTLNTIAVGDDILVTS